MNYINLGYYNSMNLFGCHIAAGRQSFDDGVLVGVSRDTAHVVRFNVGRWFVVVYRIVKPV